MQSCAGKRSLTTETAAAVVLEVTDPRELVAGDALRVVNEARAVAHRHRNAAKVQNLLARKLRNVAAARNGNAGALQGDAPGLEHFANKVHEAGLQKRKGNGKSADNLASYKSPADTSPVPGAPEGGCSGSGSGGSSFSSMPYMRVTKMERSSDSHMFSAALAAPIANTTRLARILTVPTPEPSAPEALLPPRRTTSEEMHRRHPSASSSSSTSSTDPCITSAPAARSCYSRATSREHAQIGGM